MRKKISRVTAAIAALALTACSAASTPAADTAADTASSADAVQAEETQAGAGNEGSIKAVYGEIRTEFNDALDLSDYPLTPSDVPSDYSVSFEAEEGAFTGNVNRQERPEASGGAYVSGLNLEGDRLDIPVTVEYDGFYDINVLTKGSGGNRENYVLVDDEQIGTIVTGETDGLFGDTLLYNIYLGKGEHTLSLTPSWG
ncbi:MAG: hypothetical protein IJ080_02750, partial [Oscillospiraceae bacterium]|nr:hypothetical protein [Oscillospiraceae bacterium]